MCAPYRQPGGLLGGPLFDPRVHPDGTVMLMGSGDIGSRGTNREDMPNPLAYLTGADGLYQGEPASNIPLFAGLNQACIQAGGGGGIREFPVPTSPYGVGTGAVYQYLPTGQPSFAGAENGPEILKRVLPPEGDGYLKFEADGTVTYYHEFLPVTHPNGAQYRIEWKRDGFDNLTSYHYSAPLPTGASRLERIVYPTGIEEHWNWSPTWAGIGYGGIEVTYTNVAQAGSTGAGAIAEADLTWGMLFKGLPGGSTTPFDGAAIYRRFYPKTPHLAALLGANPNDPWGSDDLYDVTTNTTDHRVREYHYVTVLGESHIQEVREFRSATMHAAAQPNYQVIESFTYIAHEQRVSVSSHTDRYGETTTYAYPSDNELAYNKYVHITNPFGTRSEYTYDEKYRPLHVRVVPNAGGLPRTNDPNLAAYGANALPEPAFIEWSYEYGPAACSCGSPTKYTSPSGRETTYTWDSSTGRLRSKTEPNPSNVVGAPATVTTEYEWTWDSTMGINGQLEGTPALLEKLTIQEGTVFKSSVDHTHTWEARPSGHGNRPTQVVATTSPITLVDGTTQILTAEKTFNSNGTVAGTRDFDGVKTVFAYWPNFLPNQIIRGEHAGETITEELDYDGWGRLLAMRSHVGTPHEQETTFDSTVDGAILGSQTIGVGVFQKVERYLDIWGNTAVVRTKNADSAGNPPLAHGAVTAGREWIRNESHFEHSRMRRRYVDRLSLGDEETAPKYGNPGAQLLRYDYVHRPDGYLSTVMQPNGASQSLVFDGYGKPYSSSVSDGSSTVFQARVFLNDELEPLNILRGDVSLQLWTKLKRNGAGSVTSVESPGVVGPTPPLYNGALAGKLSEFVLDYRGNTLESSFFEASTTPIDKRGFEEFEYDELGRLFKSTEHAFQGIVDLGTPRVTKYLFDGMTRVSRVDSPGGRYSEHEYDTLSRLVLTRDGNLPTSNESIREFYPNASFLKTQTQKLWEDTAGGTDVLRTFKHEYAWDTIGRLVSVSNIGNGSSTPLTDSFTYFSTGFTESHTDPAGKLEKFLPDALGRMVEHVRYGSGSDVIHNAASYVDYSTTGRTSEVRRQVLQAPQGDRVTTTHFDFVGRRSVLMYPGATTEPTPQSPYESFAWLFEYDAASRLSSVHDGDGLHTQLFYNGMGQLIGQDIGSSLTNPEAKNVAKSFSPTREMLVRDALGIVTQAWSFKDNLVFNAELFETDSLGRTHQEAFNFGMFGQPSWHDISSIYSPTDTDFRSGLDYSITSTSALALDFTPDAIGRVSQITMAVPGASARTLAEYGHMGSRTHHRTTFYTSSLTGLTENEYDDYGRHLKLAHSSATAQLPTFEYRFDAAGNLVKEAYDKANGNTATEAGDRFVYDDFDRLTQGWLGVDDATMQLTNPNVHLPALDETNSGYVTKLTYGLDHAGNRTEVVTKPKNGAATTEDYETQESGQGPSNRYDSAGSDSLEYDNRGNLIFDGTYFYNYDFRNRLSEVWVVSQSQSSSSSQSSSFGAMSLQSGSLLESELSTQPTITVESLRAARDVALANAPDLLTLVSASGSIEVSAPIVGASQPSALSSESLLSASSTQSSSQQSSSSSTLDLVAGYVYDAFNRRLTKAVIGESTTLFTYDGWREAQELVPGQSTNEVQKQFVWGRGLNELVCYLRSDSQGGWDEFFIHGGGQDSVMRVVDSSGELVEGTDYDPFGQATIYNLVGVAPEMPAPQALGNRSTIGLDYGWKGHRVDHETGLTYMRNRYYAPSLGRFLSVDPLGVWGDPANHGNGYSYGANAPQVNWDPFGLQAITAWIGGAGDAGTQIVKSMTSDDPGVTRKGEGEHKYFEHGQGGEVTEWIRKERDDFIQDQLEEMERNGEHGPPRPPIINIVGHSWGGAAAIDVAQELAEECDPNLITLDPVSFWWYFDPGLTHWINVHQDKQGLADYATNWLPLGGGLIGGMSGSKNWVLSGGNVDGSDIVSRFGQPLFAEDGATNIETLEDHDQARPMLDEALDAGAIQGTDFGDAIQRGNLAGPSTR